MQRRRQHGALDRLRQRAGQFDLAVELERGDQPVPRRDIVGAGDAVPKRAGLAQALAAARHVDGGEPRAARTTRLPWREALQAGSQRPCACQPRQITHTLGSARASARRPAPTEGVNATGSIYWPDHARERCARHAERRVSRGAAAQRMRARLARAGAAALAARARWRAAWPSACRSSASRRSAGSTGGPISVAAQPRCVPPIRRRSARRWSPTRRCATAASRSCRRGGRDGAGARRPRRCCCQGSVEPASADMLWANMMLHACADIAGMFASWHRALAADGFVMFSTLGPGTLPELRLLYERERWGPAFYPFADMHDLGDLLVHAGFADPVMDQEQLTLTWSSPQAALQELRALGGNLHAARHAGPAHAALARAPAGATGAPPRRRWPRRAQLRDRLRPCRAAARAHPRGAGQHGVVARSARRPGAPAVDELSAVERWPAHGGRRDARSIGGSGGAHSGLR